MSGYSDRKRKPAATTHDSFGEESEEESGEESNSEGESNEDSDPEDEIQVDFEGQSISESDYHGIMRFLQELLSGSKLNLGQIVEEIISQEGIGSVIKTGSQDQGQGEGQGEGQEEGQKDGGEDTLGVTTVLLFDRIKNSQLAKQIDGMFRNQSEKFGMGPDMMQILEGKVGWLIHERFQGIPPEIAPPLLSSLRSELAAILGKVKSVYLVAITKGYHMPKTVKGKKKKKKKVDNISPLDVVCEYPEMEEFLKESVFSYAWPIPVEDTASDGLNPVRVCFAIEYKSFHSITKTLQESL